MLDVVWARGDRSCVEGARMMVCRNGVSAPRYNRTPPIRFLPSGTYSFMCLMYTFELGPLFRFCVNKIGGHVHSLGGSFVCLTFAPIVITSEDGAHLSLVDWERMLSDPAKDFNESPCGSYTALSIFTKPGVVARCPPSFCREIPVLAGSLLVYFYTNHIKTWGA